MSWSETFTRTPSTARVSYKSLRLPHACASGWRIDFFRGIAQSMADRGPRSLAKITGADLLLSVSLDGPDGFDKTVFVQAKYDRNVNRDDLLDAVNVKQVVARIS